MPHKWFIAAINAWKSRWESEQKKCMGILQTPLPTHTHTTMHGLADMKASVFIHICMDENTCLHVFRKRFNRIIKG